MKTLILNTTNRLIMGILLVFSVFLLIRGHNLPGGGFTGGLVAGSAFALQALAYGVPAARRVLVFDPRTFLAAGLVTAILSSAAAAVRDLPYFTGLWLKQVFPVVGKVGTPIVFDIGVYLVVLGVVTLFVFSLAPDEGEEERWN